MAARPTIFISAGEASGDLYAGALAAALGVLRPGCRIVGMGGGRMEQAGVELLIDVGDSSVVGLVEVLRQIPEFLRKRRRLKRWIAAQRPDAVVLVDFPDFNLALGEYAHGLGVPVVYFIPPKAWAWRPYRAERVRRFATRVVSVLPFEAEFYARVGARVEYVGHPLIDIVLPLDVDSQTDARRALGIPSRAKVLGLLPGSRRREVVGLLPRMLGAATRIQRGTAGLHVVVPTAPAVEALVREIVLDYQSDHGSTLPTDIVSGETYKSMRACDALLAAAGTVTLEAAILGVPMVVVYRMFPLTHALVRRLVRVRYGALPNLIANAEIVPELIQDAATAENMASAAARLLDDPDAARAQESQLRDVVAVLGEGGAVTRAAEAVLSAAEA